MLRFWANDVELDLTDAGIFDLKLQVGYSQPARLSWSMIRPQHSTPIPYGAFIAFVDDTHAGPETPLFEGHVHEITPSEANRVDYVAYDATRRAGQEITVMNGPHVDPGVVPRAVFNPRVDTDDDYAFASEVDATTGQIVATLLDNAASELVPRAAAPPIGAPYLPADLASLTFKPQEKLVFQSETLRAALEQALGFHPSWRFVFIPGSAARVWRFFDVALTPAITLTLNHFPPGGRHVLSLNIQRSLERRASAVSIYGPPQLVNDVASVSAGGLTPLWTELEGVAFATGGPLAEGIGQAARAWRVADPLKRQLGRVLPQPVAVPTGQVMLAGQPLTFYVTRRPTLVVTFDSGSTWWPVAEVILDTNSGTVFAPMPLYRFNPDTSVYEAPDDVRFYFSHYAAAMVARFPTTGFAGTAFSIGGLTHEMKIHDESLAVGYENFQAVTTTERLAQFSLLAEGIHRAHADIAHTGGCSIDGLDYEFLRLGRRVNIAAVDGQGLPLSTGWESINAIVTDVEYDFAARLTTLTFSGDHLEYLQSSPDRLKRSLKIEAVRNRSTVLLSFNAPGFFEATSTPIDDASSPFSPE